MKREKILFVCHSHSAFANPLTKALQKLGKEVVFFDHYSPNYWSKIIGFTKNTIFPRSKTLQRKLNEYISHFFLETTFKVKPDYIFIFKGNNINPQAIKKVKKVGYCVINWYPDYMEDFDWIREHADDYSHFFNSCEVVIANLKKIGIKGYYLPFGYNPDLSLTNKEKKYDIVFVGQFTKRREYFFSALDSLDFHVWGYEPYWRQSRLFTHFHRQANFSETKKIIRSAKIVVNVLTCEDDVPIRSVNYRVFETTGLGTFLLNWYHDPIDKFFVDGKEIVNFKTPQDLREKVEFYLKHDDKREKIAKAGWERTKRDHTFRQRFIEMFKVIDEL